MPDRWDAPEDWSPLAERLYGGLVDANPRLADNDLLKHTYHLGWHEPMVGRDIRNNARAYVKETVWREYGIDFDEYFDWADWREQYED